MHTRFQLLISLVLMLAASASQAEPATSPERTMSPLGFLVNELVALPHPMRIIRSDPDRFGITPDQLDSLRREVMEVYPPELHPRVQRAWHLEQAIYQAVIERGESASAVAEQLDELTRVKREVTDIRIQGLNRFRSLLQPAQYQAVMAASAEAARGRP